MLVAEALNTKIRVLNTHDFVGVALKKMDELRVNKLPVIDPSTHKVVGQINREKVSDDVDKEDPISVLDLEDPVVIFNNQHLFHAIRLMLHHEMSLLPVVDKNDICLGIILKHHMLELLGRMLNLMEYGSIITIRLGQQNFTLSEIVQLIEAENGKILGITVEPPDAELEDYEVSIKINLKDVSRVASALRRHGYNIFTEVKSESHKIDLETRADEFLQYLDM